jgi:hypothetical protein
VTAATPLLSDHWRSLPGRAAGAARRHRLVLALLVLGVAFRVLVQIAYRPLLLYIDSYTYLDNLHRLDPTGENPIGYNLFLLRPVLALGNLAVLAVLQHLIGLGMGVAIYALLLRRGTRRWVAALAAAPVLLDAYQVQIEHNLMADTLFQAMLLAAVAVLTWRRTPGYATAAVAGALLGAAVLVRLVGEPLVLPAIAYVVLVSSGGWRRVRLAATVAVCFAAPVLAYAADYQHHTGKLGISNTGGAAMYGRVAAFVDCYDLPLPAYERALCPAAPVGERAKADDLVNAPESPRRQVQPPPGKSAAQVERDFARRAIAHQPLDYLAAVSRDFAKGFAPTRVTFPGDVHVDRWWFPLQYPVWGPRYSLHDAVVAVERYGGGGPAVQRPLAEVLQGFQRSVGYTPGPALALALLLGLLAALGAGRTADRQQRAACLLYTTTGAGVLLTAALYQFSWRYQLPGLVLLPLAGALGATVLVPLHRPRCIKTGTSVVPGERRRGEREQQDACHAGEPAGHDRHVRTERRRHRASLQVAEPRPTRPDDHVHS